MRFYKVVENDNILFIGKGNGGEEITEAEYEAIKADAIAYAAANPLMYRAYEHNPEDILN